MTRPARAVIDPSAIIWNLGCVRRAAPGAKVLAVVKADAYGHGLERVAPFVSTVDGLAVASVEEALALRDVARPEQAIVLLEGPFEFSELTAITEAGLETVIHTDEQVAMLKRAACELPVWLKFDSGMHRLGFEPERFAKIVAEVRPYAKPLRLMTHFANAHRRGDPSMLRQLSVFNAMAGAAKEERSLANSGAILSLPQAHADWVRPGLMLYGVSPIADCSASSLGLSISALSPTAEVALAIGPCIMVLNIMLGDASGAFAEVPESLQPISKLSLIRHAFEGVLCSEFEGLVFEKEDKRDGKSGKGTAARVARRFQEGVAPRNGEDVLEGLGLPVRGHARKALRSQVGVTALNVAVTYTALVCKKGK